ncbi:UNVERIFIED_CONTAM: hypothetical protein K2H54_034870 [Gekko kuhli]
MQVKFLSIRSSLGGGREGACLVLGSRVASWNAFEQISRFPEGCGRQPGGVLVVVFSRVVDGPGLRQVLWWGPPPQNPAVGIDCICSLTLRWSVTSGCVAFSL